MKLIAHRCGTDKYPQLSIASAAHSLACGAVLVEMDTRFTSDGVIVLNHDDDAKYLFGVEKAIKDMTSHEFLSLRYLEDLRYGSSSLENMLKFGIRDILFHVNVGGERIHELIALCQKYGVMNSAVFGVNSVADVALVKSYGEDIKVLAFMPHPYDIKGYADAGADCIRLWEHGASDENIEEILAAGKKVWIMACSEKHGGIGYTDKANISIWESKGVDAVLVDKVCDYL